MTVLFKYNWLVRYKLYHIPFWMLYNYLWWAIQSGDPLGAAANVLHSAYSVKYLFYVLFQAAAACFNLYVLIPRFLEKGRLVVYITCLLLTIVAAAALIVPGYYLSSALSGKTYAELYGTGSPRFAALFIYNSFPATVAGVTLAMSIKLARNWLHTRRREQLLEKEKLETELNFLKYQFNPHFLFNSINSIFFLIHKNPDMASDSLAKFSDLLRYQLYECNDKQIPLRHELGYLENFIELEKLRQNIRVQVTMELGQEQADCLCIAPFILMTFVENACKHVSKHTAAPNWIKLFLRVQEEQLHFEISNSTAASTTADVVRYGGIGLKNVQRRLDLLYPGMHRLRIQNNDNRFEVALELQLSPQTALQPLPQLALT